MRAVAHELGVSPNALYSHVADKDALIDAVLDDVLAEIRVDREHRADPVRGLRAMMHETHRVLLAHAELVPLYVARQGARGPRAQRLGDQMLEMLHRLGVPEARAREAMRVLIIYSIGSAAFAARSPFEAGDAPPMTPADVAADFEAGLDWLLAGMTAARAARG